MALPSVVVIPAKAGIHQSSHPGLRAGIQKKEILNQVQDDLIMDTRLRGYDQSKAFLGSDKVFFLFKTFELVMV